MKKKKHPNNEADMVNPNKGTDGTNITYDKAKGNTGWQKNPLNPANQKNDNDKK